MSCSCFIGFYVVDELAHDLDSVLSIGDPKVLKSQQHLGSEGHHFRRCRGFQVPAYQVVDRFLETGLVQSVLLVLKINANNFKPLF